LARRLTSAPNLEVLQAVIVPLTIFVVNVLTRREEPAEVLFHHKTMFQNVSSFRRIWSAGLIYVYVSMLVLKTMTLSALDVARPTAHGVARDRDSTVRAKGVSLFLRLSTLTATAREPRYVD
jgi:hypothetical protein